MKHISKFLLKITLWFNTSAKKLTKDQATAIAAILPNPLKYSANPSSKFINSRKSWIKQQMQNFGEFTLNETKN